MLDFYYHMCHPCSISDFLLGVKKSIGDTKPDSMDFFPFENVLESIELILICSFSILFNADTIIASLLKTIYHGIVLSCFSKFNNFLWDSCCSSVMSIRYQCFILQGDKGCMEGDMFFYYKSNAILKILCHIICPHVFLIFFLFFYNVTFLFYVYYIVSTHSHKCRD